MIATAPATFILSLDCEGKWGMADALTPSLNRMINDESLAWAYRTLFDLLDRNEIAATFAVVGLFAGDEDEPTRHRAILDASPAHRTWMEPVWRELAASPNGGWFVPGLIEQVQLSGRHEVASHGFTHVPFDNRDMTDSSRRLELSLVYGLGQERGVRFETLVYPRNKVIGTEMLGEYGFSGYRAREMSKLPTVLTAAGTLLSEFAVLQRSQRAVPSAQPVAVPSGVFLNWGAGLRRLVPRGTTLMRLRHMLGHAERTGGVVHLWFHPHNMVTASSQAELVRAALDLVARWQRDGRIIVRTQAEYCRAAASNAAPMKTSQ